MLQEGGSSLVQSHMDKKRWLCCWLISNTRVAQVLWSILPLRRYFEQYF